MNLVKDNMQFYNLFIIGLFYCSFVFSQHTSDSILSTIAESDDSTKIRILLDETWNIRSNEPLKAADLANHAKLLAKKISNKILEAEAENYLGIIHTNIGATELALDFHFSALKIAQEAKSSEQIAYSYNNIGGVYRIKNELTLASENIQKAVEIFESISDNRGLAYCYINLGRLYKIQENYERSFKYFENSLAIANELNNEDMRARILLEIADLSVEHGLYSKASESLHELEKLYHKINYKKGLAEVWHKTADLYLNDNKPRNALEYAVKALQTNKEILNYEGEVNNLAQVSLIYLALGKTPEGEKYLYRALNKAREKNESSLLIVAYFTLYKFYKKKGSTSKALDYYEKYNHLRDSVYSNEEMVKLGELESLIRIQKTESENEYLQKDLENQTTLRNYSVIIAVLFLIIVIIMSLRFYEKKKSNEMLQQTNAVKDKFFRIIAHDLREPFSALFGGIELLKENYDDLTDTERKDTIDTIGQTVKSNYELLENLLMWSRSQSNVIKFQPEKINIKELIDKNITLVQYNLSSKQINVKVDCDNDLTISADEQMFNSILRNLIFNAVKFTKINGDISISAEQDNNNIKIKISDTGLGMYEETINNLFNFEKKTVSKGTAGESGSGLGLILIKEFVEKHNGKISIDSVVGKGSTFTLFFPV